MDEKFQNLARDLAAEPTPELRSQITRLALRMQRGIFIAWQGAHGAPAESSPIEIEQPICFITDDQQPPTIKQSYQVILATSPSDILHYLPAAPTGLLSLPSQYLEVFNSGATPVEHAGAYHQPLYDRNYVHTSGTAQLNFFQIPLGGTPAGATAPKTQVDTNASQAGGHGLPYPRNLCITGFSIYPDASADAEDAAKFLDNSWFRMFIGTCDYLALPLSLTATTSSKPSQGYVGSFKVPTPVRAIHGLREPFMLRHGTNYRCEINCPRPQQYKKSFGVYCIMHGYFVHLPDA